MDKFSSPDIFLRLKEFGHLIIQTVDRLFKQKYTYDIVTNLIKFPKVKILKIHLVINVY